MRGKGRQQKREGRRELKSGKWLLAMFRTVCSHHHLHSSFLPPSSIHGPCNVQGIECEERFKECVTGREDIECAEGGERETGGSAVIKR